MIFLFLTLNATLTQPIVLADVVAMVERFNEWYSTAFDPQKAAEEFIEWRNGT